MPLSNGVGGQANVLGDDGQGFPAEVMANEQRTFLLGERGQNANQPLQAGCLFFILNDGIQRKQDTAIRSVGCEGKHTPGARGSQNVDHLLLANRSKPAK